MLSKILYGKKGCNFEEKALPYIKKALCQNQSGNNGCTCYSCQLPLSAHPDFRQYKKTAYRVEDVEELLCYTGAQPMIAPVRVAYIENIDSITEHSQNKLLKELEDNSHFMMVATAKDTSDSLLSTIKSRTESVYLKLTMDEFRNHVFAEKNINESLCRLLKTYPEDDVCEIMYCISEGDMSAMEFIESLVSVFWQVKEVLETRRSDELLSILHLKREKDPDEFFDTHKGYADKLFDYIALCSSKKYMSCRDNYLLNVMELCCDAKKSVTAKTDFFTEICKIISLLKQNREENEI